MKHTKQGMWKLHGGLSRNHFILPDLPDLLRLAGGPEIQFTRTEETGICTDQPLFHQPDSRPQAVEEADLSTTEPGQGSRKPVGAGVSSSRLNGAWQAARKNSSAPAELAARLRV